MSEPTGRIRSEFSTLNSQRQGVLDRAYLCSALTIPTLLPYKTATKDTILPRAYQSIGSRGTRTIVSKMKTSLFSPGMVWFKHTPSVKLMSDPNVTDADLRQLEALLYARDLLVYNKLEASNYGPQMRHMIEHIIVLGNGCYRIKKNGAIHPYRLDNWVHRRVDGEMLAVIYVEKLDPLQLTDKQLTKAGLERDKLQKILSDEGRLVEVHTKSERQSSGKWLVQQEIKGKIVEEWIQRPALGALFGRIPIFDHDCGCCGSPLP